MEVLEDVAAWGMVIVLGGFGLVLMVRDARRDRAQRRSVVAGRSIRYGPPGSYRPRSALWTGLMLAWIGMNVGLMVLVFPHPAVIAAAVAVLLLATYFLLAHLATRVVEGPVLERKIIHSGEDGNVENFWIAVDDGRDPIAGTPVSRGDYARVATGGYVRLHLTGRGQVKRLDVMEK